MPLQKAWKIYRASMFSTIGVYLLGLGLEAEWLMFAALGLILASVIFGLIACRCRNCGHFLLWHIHFWKKPDYCPACGESLDW